MQYSVIGSVNLQQYSKCFYFNRCIKIFSHCFSENEVNVLLPNIDFTADWEENVHGELGVGRQFQINYVGSRLQAPVIVEYKFNDGPDYQSKYLVNPDTKNIYHATISIPVDADKVVIWFKHKNDPDKYDSDFGQNYHFPITKPSIVFLNGWQEKQHGDLVPGGSFDLFYDSRRLKEGVQVEAQMKFVDKVVGKTLDVSDESSFETAVISIPEDAEKLEMWFYYEEPNGTKHWDSRFGQNYHFNLS